jgi:hypothetical protein
MKFRHFTALHTDFGDEECRRRLLESIDPERRTIFSLSGYKGSASIIGWVDGYNFYLHKRRYFHNDFAPVCRGSLLPQDKGTRIECYFDVPRWTQIFMRFWLAGAILIGVPIFVISLLDLLKTGIFSDGDQYLGLAVPVALVLFGIFLPMLGLLISEPEEGFILEFLQSTLVARIPNST